MFCTHNRRNVKKLISCCAYTNLIVVCCSQLVLLDLYSYNLFIKRNAQINFYTLQT